MVGGEQNASTQKLENSELLSSPSSNDLLIRDPWMFRRHSTSKEGQHIRPWLKVELISPFALKGKFVYLISAILLHFHKIIFE